MSRELPLLRGESRAPKFRKLNVLTVALCIAAATGDLARPIRADIVDMQNGDRYNGTVLGVSSNSLVLQSEVLGKITLPRAKVSSISLGAFSAPNPARSAAAIAGNSRLSPVTKSSGAAASPSSLAELGTRSELVRQVKSQFLSDAGPEANEKFDQLMNGLISGKLTVADLRKEAKSTADQVRALQKELGPEASGAFDGYLAILDHFLSESAAPNGVSTNSTAPLSNPLTKSLLDED